MKKTISILAVSLLLFSMLSFSAAAQSFPCFPPFPVFGRYTSPVSQGSFVKLKVHDTNLNQDITIESDVNAVDEYSFDLANLPNCYFSVNTAEISVCDNNPACKFTFTWQGKNKIERHFLFTSDPNIVAPSNTNVVPSGSGFSRGGGGHLPVWNCVEWTTCTKEGLQERTCISGSTSKKESQSCSYTPPIEPKPLEVPVPAEEPQIIKEETPIEVPIKEEVPAEESNISIYLISLIAAIIGIFAWGKGFAGLIKHKLKQADMAEKSGNKELAKKYRATAEKMAKSVITNFLAGKYKK